MPTTTTTTSTRPAMTEADLFDLLQRGKLEQVCPGCGRNEAAGSFCTRCYRPTGPDDWLRNNDKAERDARLMAVETPYTPPKRGSKAKVVRDAH